MLQYQISNGVINGLSLINYATIIGKLVPVNHQDYMKLVTLAYDFRRAVLYTTRMIARNIDTNSILGGLRKC